ncbi:MAG: 4Fe-4S binding protein [Anaerolineae bacterium]|nr:4Fe-4S binding protein [Anaerolineae bacterium]
MMPSLSEVADALAQFGDLTPKINADLCLNQRHRYAGQCTACADVCPLAAITLDVTPQIDPGVCQACGACAAACPVGALYSRQSPLEIVREARKTAHNGTIHFACKAAGSERIAATRIPCCGALAPELYIALAAAGIHDIQLYTADCATCALHDCLALSQHFLETAQCLLAQLNLTIHVTYRLDSPPPAESPRSAVSRRRFLTTFFQSSSAAEDVLDDLTAAGLPWRRVLLIDALMRVTLPADATASTETGLWGSLRVSETCIGCEMCAQFCPTGALAITTDAQDEVTVWFNAARCTACGLCTRVCFKHSIHFGSHVALPALVEGTFEALWQGQPGVNALNAGAVRKARPR